MADEQVESQDNVEIINVDYNTKFCLTETTRKDMGVYTLVAVNSVGRDEASVEVNVLGKPVKPDSIAVSGVRLDDGGLPISGYMVEKMEVGTGVPAGHCDGEKQELDVNNLETSVLEMDDSVKDSGTAYHEEDGDSDQHKNDVLATLHTSLSFTTAVNNMGTIFNEYNKLTLPLTC